MVSRETLICLTAFPIAVIQNRSYCSIVKMNGCLLSLQVVKEIVDVDFGEETGNLEGHW